MLVPHITMLANGTGSLLCLLTMRPLIEPVVCDTKGWRPSVENRRSENKILFIIGLSFLQDTLTMHCFFKLACLIFNTNKRDEMLFK